MDSQKDVFLRIHLYGLGLIRSPPCPTLPRKIVVEQTVVPIGTIPSRPGQSIAGNRSRHTRVIVLKRKLQKMASTAITDPILRLLRLSLRQAVVRPDTDLYRTCLHLVHGPVCTIPLLPVRHTKRVQGMLIIRPWIHRTT